MRRVAPAFALFFLSPLVAEFLLGDFTLAAFYAVLFLAPMYGGGALLIREVTRRTGRGWPTILLLALAYGVFEEGITTESLFDPGYVNAHLLDHGYVQPLGIAIPWTLFVLTLHTVWSISTPIALAEGLVPNRRTTPWLKKLGLTVAAVLFVLGSAITTFGSYVHDHFMATWPHLAVVMVIAIALVVVALRLPRTAGRPAAAPSRAAPPAGIAFGLALVAGAAFELSFRTGTVLWVAVMVVDFAVVIGLVTAWSRRSGWGPRHVFALAAGASLTYAWASFLSTPLMGGGPVITPVSHVVFALAAVALLVVQLRKLRRAERAEVTAAAQPPTPVNVG